MVTVVLMVMVMVMPTIIIMHPSRIEVPPLGATGRSFRCPARTVNDSRATPPTPDLPHILPSHPSLCADGIETRPGDPCGTAVAAGRGARGGGDGGRCHPLTFSGSFFLQTPPGGRIFDLVHGCGTTSCYDIRQTQL